MATALPTPDLRISTLLAREFARPISVAEYHRMIDTGILDEDEGVELLEGVIVNVSTQKRPHARAIQWLNRHLLRKLDDEYAVLPQLPLTLGRFSEPEPDLAVVRAEDARSNDEHPCTALLVIEVSTASLRRDRGLKAALQAHFGIPEYWIVNLNDCCVEVQREPQAGRYSVSLTLVSGDTLACSTIPGLTLAVADLFAS